MSNLGPEKVPRPNDAHKFEGRCRFPFCPGYPRAGLLTLVGNNGRGEPETWAEPIITTNGTRDTIEACAYCVDEWGRTRPDTAAFRAMPIPQPQGTVVGREDSCPHCGAKRGQHHKLGMF